MTEKIRVVHFCNQLSLGGTERTMEIFCRYLNKNFFDVYAVSFLHSPRLLEKLKVELGVLIGHASAKGKKKLWSSMNARVPNFQKILGEEKVVFANDLQDLKNTLKNLSPDILHVHYSGNPEPPTSDENILSTIPVTVTTNQFERENTSSAHRHVKKIFFPSRWLLENKALWAKNDLRSEVFPNPIEKPFSTETLRNGWNIPQNAFVIGRVGRADNGIHDPIALQAFKEIEDEKTFFVALSPPENMLRQARELGLKNFISLPPTADEIFLSKFYNSIDVLAHARRDGETFGCNIAEAMMHGKPVVSHLCDFMNAQTEIISDTGFVCEKGDYKTYAEKLRLLRDNPDLRHTLGAKSKLRAETVFEAQTLTRRLEKTYMSLLSKDKERANTELHSEL